VKQRFNVSLSRTVGVVVAERLLDIFVVFALLLVGGYIAFGRTVLPDLRLVYLSGAALALLMVVAFVAVYFVAPRMGRFFPRRSAGSAGSSARASSIHSAPSRRPGRRRC